MQQELATPRKRRIERGWTLDDLATRCMKAGVPTTRATLSRVERWKQVPRPELRSVLARLLDIEVTDFGRAGLVNGKRPYPENWQCASCGHSNPPHNSKCANCGRS